MGATRHHRLSPRHHRLRPRHRRRLLSPHPLCRRPTSRRYCRPPDPLADTHTLAGVPMLRVTLRVGLVLAVVVALIVVATSTRSGLLWRLSTFSFLANVHARAYCLW